MVLLLLVGIGQHAWAKPGSVIEESGTHYSGATYREMVRDLRVKALGGYINVRRHWRQGRWWFNPQWSNLKFFYKDNNVIDTLPSVITRYDLDYQRANGTSNVYHYRDKLTITRTDTGWRWADRKGNWIEYDADGVTQAYGDKNNNRVSFRRNLAGQIEGVLDTNSRELVTFTLNELGDPTQVVDYSGRQVTYHWDDTSGDLTSVTDVRGQSWQYTYQRFNNSLLTERKTLASRTDPLGRTVQFIHE
ncbi:MAG: RHS repeat protein, partial [Chromatiales bacterium]|nr:RHS repeat protein [Chromatiales bacterium]